MKLLTRITLVLVSVILVTGLLNYLVLQVVVRPKFLEVEAEFAGRNIERVRDAVQNELKHLRSLAHDWAFWDDTYEFVSGERSGFIEANLGPETIESLGVDLIAFYDATGKSLWSWQAGSDDAAPVNVADLLSDPAAFSRFLHHADAESEVSGVVPTRRGPALLVSLPILRTDGSGAIAGTLVMGKDLDEDAIQALRDQTHVRFVLLPAGGPVDSAFVPRATVDSSILFKEVDSSTALVRAAIPGLEGRPAAVVEIETRRNILQSGEEAIDVATITLLVIGLLVIVVTGLILKFIAVGPIASLTQHVLAIRQTGDLSRRSGMRRGDEIGILAHSFDSMLEQLEETRGRLLEQSYYSGIAETSAAVLHNVRNALNPILVNLWKLGKSSQGGKSSIAIAFDEYRAPETPEERRSALGRFLQLAFADLAERQKEVDRLCETIANQSKQIEEILQHNDNVSSDTHLTEQVDIAEVVSDASRLLTAKGRGKIDVAVRFDKAALKPVVGNRIVLTQIVGNLLVNAGEAIAAAGLAEGRIEIDAGVEEIFGNPMLHLTVRDNGEGFDPAQSETLFRRGFSTRSHKKGGIGLHWCANSIASMGGKITLESEGRGKGATARLLLPVAPAGEAEAIAA